MSDAWKGGSTRRHRKVREYVLARDGYRCRAHTDGWCDQVQRKNGHECTGRAELSGPHVGHAHHTKGKGVTGDDPAFMVASCANCNYYIGDPRKSSPQPKRVSRW